MHFWGVRSAAQSRSALLLEGFLWRCTFGVYFASKDTPLCSVAEPRRRRHQESPPFLRVLLTVLSPETDFAAAQVNNPTATELKGSVWRFYCEEAYSSQ